MSSKPITENELLETASFPQDSYFRYINTRETVEQGQISQHCRALSPAESMHIWGKSSPETSGAAGHCSSIAFFSGCREKRPHLDSVQ